MDDETILRSNTYGQYDQFKYSNHLDNGLNYLLWAFTPKRSLRNAFFKERRVENRYYEKILDMSDESLSDFMFDNFSKELLDIELDTRTNIGVKSGYVSHDERIVTKESLKKEDRKYYTSMVMTKTEYSYLISNLGEICSEYMRHLYEIYDMPVSSSLFKNPLKKVLDLYAYNINTAIYKPNTLKYIDIMPREKEGLIRYVEKQDDEKYEDRFSLLNLFYITYADMIF